jgi:hypothetical protein
MFRSRNGGCHAQALHSLRFGVRLGHCCGGDRDRNHHRGANSACRHGKLKRSGAQRQSDAAVFVHERIRSGWAIVGLSERQSPMSPDSAAARTEVPKC